MFKQKLLIISICIVSIGVVSLGALSRSAAPRRAEPVTTLTDEQIYEKLKKFAMVFQLARENFVEPVNEKQMIEGAISGMLRALDPHSSYLSADDFRDFNDRAGGSFGGLGIQITADRGAIRVISPMDGTPAERAGIQPGDFITHIDGEPVFDMTLNQAVRRMRGRVGTRVRITVITEGSEPRELNLTRATVRVESVTHEIMGDGDQRIGFIRISDFGAVTTRQLREAITALQAKNVIGYVLDVRNNPGGYLTAAINVADSFLDAGQEIVSIRGRSEQVDRTNSRGADLIAGLPIVVLINNGSASASEIVAGAIQDNRRGIVMGSQSFGKGSVQQQMPLGDGTAIHLTIAHYYTPSGALIQGIGITPDVEVLQSRVEVIERRRRTAHTEETFRDALRAGATDDDDNAELTPAQRRARDYQLQRALDMVRAMSRLGLRPPLEEGDE